VLAQTPRVSFVFIVQRPAERLARSGGCLFEVGGVGTSIGGCAPRTVLKLNQSIPRCLSKRQREWVLGSFLEKLRSFGCTGLFLMPFVTRVFFFQPKASESSGWFQGKTNFSKGGTKERESCLQKIRKKRPKRRGNQKSLSRYCRSLPDLLVTRRIDSKARRKRKGGRVWEVRSVKLRTHDPSPELA